MKWFIPAKTFLVGEYAAIFEKPAILLTTQPCFEVVWLEDEALFEKGVDVATNTLTLHPASPAGKYLRLHHMPPQQLLWKDPYQAIGGLGASSAQFLGAYLANHSLQKQNPNAEMLLEEYYQLSWSLEGMRPSGYDVLAQSQHGAVYIHRQEKTIISYPWDFPDLGFLLLHTGKKLATHSHLKDVELPDCEALSILSSIVESARMAFIEKDAWQLITAINAYHDQLVAMHLMVKTTIHAIEHLKSEYNLLAAKGCGAMGADILLLVFPSDRFEELSRSIASSGYHIVGSHRSIYAGNGLLPYQPILR